MLQGTIVFQAVVFPLSSHARLAFSENFLYTEVSNELGPRLGDEGRLDSAQVMDFSKTQTPNHTLKDLVALEKPLPSLLPRSRPHGCFEHP